MEGVADKIQAEISHLQTERASLLAKLEKIELSLTKAQAQKVASPTWTACSASSHEIQATK